MAGMPVRRARKARQNPVDDDPILRRLRKADAEFKAAGGVGPFDTADALVAALLR